MSGTPTSADLIQASAFHHPDGSPNPAPFTRVRSEPLPASAVPQAPIPPVQMNALASLGRQTTPGSPTPPPPRPVGASSNPMLAHMYAAGQRIPRMANADLDAFHEHNAAASMAIGELLARPSVTYADVARLLTGLAERSALPAHEALQAVSKMPTDPRLLRHVLIALQQAVDRVGSHMRAEHHHRSTRS